MIKYIIAILLFNISYHLSAQQSIHFNPTTYSREFSSIPSPVLKIIPGDTVHTTSVDAVGFDQKGIKVTERGNPLTGPFFIEGAMPGDVLAVRLLDVSLNRNFATTLNALIPKMLPKEGAMKAWRSAKLTRWQLDLSKLLGKPSDSSLQQLAIPLHPFLGCIGVAPEGNKGIASGASGPYGGNMDFRFNTTGSIIYLPVYHSGGLLYLGDGHAAQGDGELNGDALETSMNFSFTVQVLKKSSFPLETPMIENDEFLMFFGIESTLDKSLIKATEHLRNWLQTKYNLSMTSVSQVIGPAVQYRLPKIGAAKVEVVAMIPKTILTQLTHK